MEGASRPGTEHTSSPDPTHPCTSTSSRSSPAGVIGQVASLEDWQPRRYSGYTCACKSGRYSRVQVAAVGYRLWPTNMSHTEMSGPGLHSSVGRDALIHLHKEGTLLTFWARMDSMDPTNPDAIYEYPGRPTHLRVRQPLDSFFFLWLWRSRAGSTSRL